MWRWLTLGLGALTLATGCQSVEPVMPAVMPSVTRHTVGRPAYLVTGAASTRAEFVDLLGRQGLHLNESQLQAVFQATAVLPSGRWSPGAEDVLAQWQQFGRSVTPGIESPAAFHDAAVTFARQRDASVGFYFDTERFRQDGVVRVAHWEPVRGQFVSLSADGAIDWYRPNTGEPPMDYLRVPQALMPGAR